jgi:hypothetical protein
METDTMFVECEAFLNRDRIATPQLPRPDVAIDDRVMREGDFEPRKNVLEVA